ncbi:putative O-glycosylation ligase, exosortase A system-associated [Altererythrobacter xixiisoli]|uniref:Putative O-glycosylation ligase, exosortase A system-associated n=1 Tax=Croceibacterium xixiisoli TaxID=1476466 RepID=A0A6I4TPC7_9SPHN|nr:putative O-glycosylation ligase, exosortase A system-associated [Croceibacterium xixiisoli]MXO97636.1 putative O-glycosylation ligase, exosortase A system-associated [Croceibacterium xixiisoli]
MLDLALLGFIGILLLMGFKRPFFWVLTYIYIDIVVPQKIGWGLVQTFQLSMIAFVAAFCGWVFLDSKKGSRFTMVQGLIVVLLLYCGMTTVMAAYPEAAWAKWNWVWKALIFAAFLPLTLRTRLRIEAAALIMVLAIATIIINGGIKTVGGGGGYGTLRLLVQEDSGLYEGSILSTAAIATIPVALWLARHGTIFKPDWRVWGFTAGLVFACLLIPVGTSARTGLICIGVMLIMIMRSVKNRALYAAGAGLALMVAIPFLPASFTERMGTIQNYQGDQSASTRVEVWKWTYHYALANPLGGGFDAYLGNSFTYNTRKVTGTPPNVTVTYEEVVENSRAYHSSYFEMLGEQGWPGLFIWLLLQGTGVWQMERLRWRFAAREGGKEGWQWGLATALQQAQIIYLVGAAFVGIAFQPFIFMLIGLQCALWSYVQRVEYAPRKANFHRGAVAGEGGPAGAD